LAVKMAPVDVQKTTLITKSRLFDWTVMPFSIKNATNTFSRTLSKVFGAYMNKFLKVSQMMLTSIVWHGRSIWSIFDSCL
jgi:hypothetical protein